MAQKFVIKEAVLFGWETMKKNFWFFVGLLVIIVVIKMIPGLFSGDKKEFTAADFAVALVSWAVQVIISIGVVKISLSFVDGKVGKIGDLFSGYRMFGKYLLSSILYSLIVFGGMLLLIVPGVIWSIKYQFYGYFIVDKGLGPVEAIKRSGTATSGAKWDLFVFGLFLGLINILGFLCLLVGLFATIPLTMLAMAFVYRKLAALTETMIKPAEASVPPAGQSDQSIT